MPCGGDASNITPDPPQPFEEVETVANHRKQHSWQDGIEGMVCSKCGRWKALSAFNKRGNAPDGLRGDCRDCQAIYAQRHYETNQEEAIEYAARYRREHPEKVRAANRHYRLAHPDKVREWKRREYANHGDAIRERSRKWKQHNPEKVAEQIHRRRALKAGTAVEPVDVAAIFDRDGHQCVYCGSTERLTLDHVVPLIRGGPHIEENLVVACRSCNCSKGTKLLSEWDGYG